MLFLRAFDITPAGEMSHGKVDNSRTRRALEIRICLPLRGPREEVKYWSRSTCNFGNFASASARLIIEPRRNPFVRRFGRYPAFRLRLTLLISHAFLRPHVVRSNPSPLPNTSSRRLKSMRENREIVSRYSNYPPTSKVGRKFAKNSSVRVCHKFPSEIQRWNYSIIRD